MTNQRTIFLVRHGQTQWNAQRRMQGQFDSPLTKLGRRQAETNAAFLAGQDIGAIYASPLGRVRETVKIIGKSISAPVTFDERLQEWHSGEWSSHLYAELKWRWPREFAEWEEDRFYVRPPQGENYPDMIKRARSALDEALKNPAPVLAIVSHGMVARAFMAVLLGLKEKQILSIRQRNDVIFRIQLGGDTASVDHFIRGDGPYPSYMRGH